MPVSGRAFALLLCALGAAVLSAAPTFGQLAAEDMGLSENGIEPFCFYNRVAKKVLCRVSGAGRSGQFALGSENGNWAFMMQYGRPKIMKYAKGNVTTEWSSKNAVNLQATPCKSTSFSVIFNITGIVDFRCNGKSYGSLTVYNKRYPKRATIDNNGTVRFIDAKGAVLVTIDPSSGKGPQPPLAFIIRGPAALANTTPRKATTMKKLPTTVKRVYTTPRSIGTLVFPKANPRNILLQSDCKYVPVPYFSSYDPKKTFNIELIGCGTDSVVDGLFVKAAMTWMTIIAGDVTDFSVPGGGVVDCLANFKGEMKMRCGFVDDIIIGYTRIFIDGPGGVLASGGPLMSRGADWPVSRSLPVSGWIEVDSGEPLDSSYAQDVILHEMGHVLGFGTIFSDLKLLSPSNCEAQAELGDVPTPKFLGKAATAALPKIYYRNTSYPPIEGGVGPGTACVHWSERYLKHEIMTGFLSSSYANVISYLTAATFQDLGYTVNFASPNIDYKFNMSAPPGSRDDGTLVNITGCTKDSKSWKKFNPIPFNATEAGRRAALKDALAP